MLQKAGSHKKNSHLASFREEREIDGQEANRATVERPTKANLAGIGGRGQKSEYVSGRRAEDKGQRLKTGILTILELESLTLGERGFGSGRVSVIKKTKKKKTNKERRKRMRHITHPHPSKPRRRNNKRTPHTKGRRGGGGGGGGGGGWGGGGGGGGRGGIELT